MVLDGASGNDEGDAHKPDTEDDTASFYRRMEGPSSHKAGLARNDARIARIIDEVSKGSKFYENQRAKHAAVTLRIEKVRQRRDEALNDQSAGAQSQRQLRVENMVEQLEAERDLSRTVLHCDMDMFYAAVELQRDPSLEKKCFAVGGGVLLTASYEARKFGARSGMASFVARALCPDLVLVPAHYDQYSEKSKAVMRVLQRYDPHLHQRSLDEAYLDVTPYLLRENIGVEQLATQLRQDVRLATGLTVSVGVGPNMLLAKIASDLNKPDGQYILPSNRSDILEFMQDLSVRKVPGIGHVTERILDAFRVTTCGALWSRRIELSVCMDNFPFLLASALGIASSHVQPPAREGRKSVGRESTFTPIADAQALDLRLQSACEHLAKDLARLKYRGRTVTLVGKHDTFQRFSRQSALGSRSAASYDELYPIAKNLLEQEYAAAPNRKLTLRLLGVRVSSLLDEDSANTSPLQQWLKESNVYSCPVCGQSIPIPAASSDVQANALVNRHVDLCLNADSSCQENSPSLESKENCNENQLKTTVKKRLHSPHKFDSTSPHNFDTTGRHKLDTASPLNSDSTSSHNAASNLVTFITVQTS
ncbi:DNA-directed DNA polymerase [Malassezia psittaci]|uniref:DNA polymerase kappa n=1 Tax=Malassezia psittaci TaxID=1821823 RepID=A0AAF0FI46_9BASI|nr:DNA-directed DNA polymerase [Malassezia psittaci]